jgi:hypothetical protein
VAVARVEPAGTGRFAARIVNHGNRGALLVTLQGPDARRARLRSEPALPFGLGPGQTRLVRFTVDVPACPAPVPAAAAEQMSIEARTRDGFVEVTGWPEGLTRAALQAAREACLRAGQGNRS